MMAITDRVSKQLNLCILHVEPRTQRVWLVNIKKKRHTRDAPATPLHCRQWSNQILLSCGALLAVQDGLRFAVRVSGRFLRSAVFLCLA